jgi:hypothetical protein
MRTADQINTEYMQECITMGDLEAKIHALNQKKIVVFSKMQKLIDEGQAFQEATKEKENENQDGKAS